MTALAQNTPKLTVPFANFAHIVQESEGLYVISGQGCRDPVTTKYCGIYESNEKTEYKVSEVVIAVFKNLQSVLKSKYLSLSNISHITVYMVRKKDFDIMNAIWNKIFPDCSSAPARTTVFVQDLPGKNIIEMASRASISLKHTVDITILENGKT
jgi:enamine deaminase RidA (YjgF/YER057c/UK114 family)